MGEFEEIFQTYTDVVFRFLLSHCGDESLAEELTCETFYQAYVHIGQFRGKCKVETWLCQIAKHALYREQKRRRRLVPGEVLEQMQADHCLFQAIADKEQAMQIHRHLHRLKEPYREVFLLRALGELSFREIADVCGKSESWAKVTFYRAKSKLIEKLEGEP